MSELIAKASIEIDATKQEVWAALVSPSAIKHYMFGAGSLPAQRMLLPRVSSFQM